MNTKLATISFCFGMLVTGCANDPLVFSSGNMIGIKIAVSPSETQPLKLSVGYDGVDAAIIPTSTDSERKQLLARSHSCITKDTESKECVNFLPEEDDANEQSPDESLNEATDAPGKGGREIRYDALSVLALFDSNGGGGVSNGVKFSLGKTFATGIAAQNISAGIEAGAAGGHDEQKRCLTELERVVGAGKVDAATAAAVCALPKQ
jgi:hypothetical protein